jgi:hypothetical protein
VAENQTVTLKATGALASGANNGAKQDNKSWRGVTLFVDVSAGSGTSPTLVVKLQEWIPGSAAGAGEWVDITGATTATISVSGATQAQFTVYPGCIASANAYINRPLGEHWRYVATVGGTDTPTVTCSIHAQLHI